MYCYTILYRDYDELDLIYGYTWLDACRRANIDPSNPSIVCLGSEYED